MIAPLPPKAGQPQPADPAIAKPDPRADGDGFAEILAAAGAAAVPAPRLPGPPPALEHGPAMVRITDLLPAEPRDTQALTDPAGTTAQPDQSLPTARIFNQDGFFGTSVDAAAGTGPGAAPEIAAASLPLQESAPLASLAPEAAGPRTMPMPLDAETALAPAVPTGASGSAAFPRALLVAKGVLAAPAPVRPATFETELGPEESKPIARRLALREPTRAAVQVAMRELEQGVHVAARAEGLDAAERVRLHDEIAALLARHGLSARSIRITAPGRAKTAEERLK